MRGMIGYCGLDCEACGGFCLINYENGIYSVTVIIPEKKRTT